MKNEMQYVAPLAGLEGEIVSIAKLLSRSNLKIPAYQRPYKWTSKNVSQLFADIAVHKDKPSYRLGTVVLHRNGGDLYIVDGQQRTISLMLAVKALIALRLQGLVRKDLKAQLLSLEMQMFQPTFGSAVSQGNIRNNYSEISRIIGRADFAEEHVDFLLNRCHVVTFELVDISEAFQFFDSQNARGRDLEPHDLLKAYHLREFSDDEQVKADTVACWENSESEELASLFADYLYRIKNWSRGRSARYFGKDDTQLFKGINIDTAVRYPYAEQLRIVHHFVEDYNRQYERKIDGREMDFPFRLEQKIINGRRFFDMTAHYQARIASVIGDLAQVRRLADEEKLDGYAGKIIMAIDSYSARRRTGDRLVRMIFDCMLICYIDKFGFAEIARAIEKIFVWAYSLRVRMEAVQVASMDNHVLENNLFKELLDAIRPTEFISLSLPVIDRNRSTKTDVIYQLFKDMRYAQ